MQRIESEIKAFFLRAGDHSKRIPDGRFCAKSDFSGRPAFVREERIEIGDLQTNFRVREKIPEMPRDRHFVRKEDSIAVFSGDRRAGESFVLETNGEDFDSFQSSGRVKEPVPEAKDFTADPIRAFGKENDGSSFREKPGELLYFLGSVIPTFSIDENTAGDSREISDHRRFRHISTRDEYRLFKRSERDHVENRKVIREDQSSPGTSRPNVLGLDGDSKA